MTLQTASCYLGNKGYTIYKSSLSKKELDDLKNELTVSPFTPMAIGKVPKFPVFRENKEKIYIPRFVGNEKFGIPKVNKLSQGDDISLTFKGTLRDYQTSIINTFIDNVDRTGSGGLLEIPCGRGKTVMALDIISKIQKKTLIIVHKSFLLNQWVERIQQFIPDAKIGSIQGSTLDVEGKDIVIGMLQSLSMKDYSNTLFDSFGLTIVDEVHHIAAEVFVRSLFKIVTPIMLGLSATMNRKDGLSFVFKMFIGPVVYKEKREVDDSVLIKVHQYQSIDDDFNEVVYNFKGNPQYSTMISKLCGHLPRCEYILDILENIVINDTDDKEQIIVLAHNKNVLTFLHDAINDRNIASVGYYVGGMKEQHLKQSESKKIVIGTYSMASEALDIKTLTTLVMVTPKTDIEQSVGRILRAKHSQPLVVDIVDQHDLFQKQFKKRMAFYRKNKYKVIETRCGAGADDSKWTTLYDASDPKFDSARCKRNKSTLNSAHALLESLGIHSNTMNEKSKCLIDVNNL